VASVVVDRNRRLTRILRGGTLTDARSTVRGCLTDILRRAQDQGRSHHLASKPGVLAAEVESARLSCLFGAWKSVRVGSPLATLVVYSGTSLTNACWLLVAIQRNTGDRAFASVLSVLVCTAW
jgi:hypothetical protein